MQMEVGKCYQGCYRNGRAVKCMMVGPDGTAFVVDSDNNHSFSIHKDNQGFWKEVKIPRKASTRYVAVQENLEGQIYIRSRLFFSKEGVENFYRSQKIIDIIEINYEEKV